MMVETYLRRGQRRLENLALDPKVRSVALVAICVGSGFLLSGIGLGNRPQPVAMGLICSAIGWRALLMALGAMLGYPSMAPRAISSARQPMALQIRPMATG